MVQGGPINKIRVALCQTPAVSSKLDVGEARRLALEAAKQYILRAKQMHPDTKLVVLPEMFSCPYGTKFFKPFGERVPVLRQPVTDQSPSVKMLSEVAQSEGLWIVGGSVAEVDEAGTLYNTCVVVDSSGTIVGKHRKAHLFDIDIPGKMTFRESETLAPGQQVTVVDTPWGKMGVGICYDVRFAELALVMRGLGCQMLVYPGAFNTTTGPPHWRLLMQARALDTQSFVLACSPARSNPLLEGDYPAYGHSLVVDPWGEVKVELDEKEGIAFAEVDMDRLKEVRQNIPISLQKRTDLYELRSPAMQ